MQLKQLIQRLQSVLAEHGNIDVVIPHPNIDQSSTIGTPLFHLDVMTPTQLDHFVLVGVGSVNGLREYVAQSPVNPTFLRLSPYSMQRVQGLHDMQNGSMPVTTKTPDTDPSSTSSLAKEPETVPVSTSSTPSDEERSVAKPVKKEKKRKQSKT